MPHRPLVVFCLIGALILSGCELDTRPQDVGHFSTNRAATQDVASCNGTFRLFRDDDPTVSGALLMTVHLKTGEVVGFTVDAKQVPFAFAGSQRMQLTPGRYRWEMTADAGQTDWHQTNTVIVEVAVATVVVVLAVVTTIIAAKHV